ncbi:hypothetical protein AA309_26155 [Microvirga vignae]|uniref:Tetratricopeptide repeat protein n=1 Tax=Microvirga vignae TaxID=1225564 RepID=A0A0H1R566_9HYPH|nr:hypothetical protein [Microvirga vignae]KLK90350.1 hypothetical protein AA309_26155 [Microvirga vignae]
MSDDNWFRNEAWNPEIAEQFQARLQRSRKKPQYLRIQASILAQTYPEAALTLLEQYFASEETFDLAQAYVDQATSYMAIGNIGAALSALEAAIARERAFPNVQTRAYLILPSIIAKHGLQERYSQALDILDAYRSKPTFPIDHYQWHGARALILSDQGKSAEAADAAMLALEASRRTDSGFRHHPDIGLVQNTSDDLGKRLKRIAHATTWWRSFFR